MTALIIVLLIVFVLSIAFVLSVRGERNSNIEYFRGLKIAHRGLHKAQNVPENSMLAFSKALDKGYAIELDVHILADGTLAVFHDANLKRMAGADVKIETLSKKDLRNYYLLQTTEQIPLFSSVLELVDGRVPLLIELKPPRDVDKLCNTVAEQLEGYSGKYAIHSFDPRCVRWFKKNSPNTLRGQISQNFFKEEKNFLDKVLTSVLGLLIFNFLTKPNFVSYKFEDRNGLAPTIAQKLWKIDSFTWTVRSKEDAKKAESENRTVIFENFEY